MLYNKMLKRATSTTMVCLLTILLVMPLTVLSSSFITEVVSTESTSTSGFSSLAVDPDGNIHVAWEDRTDYGGAGTDSDVFYKAKIAGSWTTTEVVSTESTDESWYPSLAVDVDGNVHVAWTDETDYGGSGTDSDVFYKAKIAGSWTTTEVVSTESTDESFSPSLSVDPDGNVHAAWTDRTDYGGSGTDIDVFYKAKVGGSWTTTEVVSTESTDGSESPSLSVDPDRNVHVAWDDVTDYNGSGTDDDIFYKAKITGSWTTTEVVSTKSTSSSLNPSLAVDVDGNVHAAWEDRTDYGGSGTDSDVFYRMIVLPFPLLGLKARIDAIEAKLDDPNTGLAPIKSEVDKIEGKLDILLERLGIVGGLMLPTEGLKLVVNLFVDNVAAMALGILVLVGLPLLMRRVKKKS